MKKLLFFISMFLFILPFTWGYSLCFQSSPNVSSNCGGLNTGIIGGDFTDYEYPNNGWDEDYDTSTSAYSQGKYLYFNYTKPTYSFGGMWEIKSSNNPTLGFRNLTIPQACWDGYNDKIVLRAEVCNTIGQLKNNFDCHNSITWQLIDTISTALYEEGMYWEFNDIDNCINYTYPILNWTFYQSPNVITSGDSNGTFIFNQNGLNENYSLVSFDNSSVQLCSRNDTINFTMSGSLIYSADWTDGWEYNLEFIDKFINNTIISYYNLTVPKLFLNFSQATNIVVVTTENISFYNDTSILIGMSTLPIGKISVIFNNGSQYYEYYNDKTTYIDEDLYIIDDQNDYFQIRAQDETFSILSKAQIKIWEIDSTNNKTYLINSLYDNSEKSIYLDSDQFYVARSYYTGYEQEGGFSPFKPAQTEGNSYPIPMTRNTSVDTIEFHTNRDTRLPFMNNLPTYYFIDIEISSREILTEAYIDLYINDTYINTYTMSGDDYDFKMCGQLLCDYTSFTFANSYDNMTIYAFAKDKFGSANKTWVFQYFEKEQRYETAYYDILLYSRFAFLIFFMLTIVMSIAIQKKFKDYGIQSANIISVLLSFINLYMLVLAIPLTLMFIAKKVMGDDI